MANRNDSSLYADRSYFGIIRVKIGHDKKSDTPDIYFTQLIHGHINHGMNIFKPDNKFGKEYAVEIADILAKYAKYNGRRKPELLNENTYSFDYGEIA